MLSFILKAAFSGVMIALISSLAKIDKTASALLAAFPLTSGLAILLIYMEEKNKLLISDLTLKIFLITLPSLLFFLILRYLLKTIGFGPSYVASIILTLLICYIYVKVVNYYSPDFF